MNVKHALLVTAVVAVFGMGVYLFIQVRATPASASATSVTSREPTRTDPAPSPPEPRPTTPEPPRKPDGTRTVWERPGIPAAGTPTDTPPAAADGERKVNLKLDNMMELANKSYDAQEFEQAIAIAGKVLDKEPGNVRMLRIMVSSHCILGDAALAQQNYERLPPGQDREQMKVRCERYQVTLKDPS